MRDPLSDRGADVHNRLAGARLAWQKAVPMRRTFLLFLLLSTAVAASGCALDHDDATSNETTAESEDALALASLYGTWRANGAGDILSISFTRDYAQTLGGFLRGRRFETTIDTGIRCITTPCNSSAEGGGVYKLGSWGTRLTLASYDKPGRELAKVLGDYGVRRWGNTLTLTKKDGTGSQSFTKVNLHSSWEVTGAALEHAWPTRDPKNSDRLFDTRAAAESWGSSGQSGGRQWIAREGETATTATFVSGSNDLWSQVFTVDKETLAVTITAEH